MSKVIIPSLPHFYRLDDTPAFDSFTNRKEILEIAASNGDSNLNGNAAITFQYKGEDYIRLAGPNSGLRVKADFLTKSNGINDRNAHITLASNWVMYMFKSIELFAGSESLEAINNPGECADIVCHLKGTDFRQTVGENMGFIPDDGTGDAVNKVTTVVAAPTAVDNPAAADAAAIAATANTAVTNLRTNINTALANADYIKINNGIRRRYKRYNYVVANNDTDRQVEVFIPNHVMLGYCDTYDMITKFMPFKLAVTRQPATDINKVVFGEDNTSMTIRITEMTWLLEAYVPVPQLALTLDNRFSKGPLNVNYLQRYISSTTSEAKKVTITETALTKPRYVFVVCKGTTGAANQNEIDKNYSLCRNCDIQEVRVSLDTKWYPDKNYNTDFNHNRFSNAYASYEQICEAFSGSCGVTPRDFKKLYTIFAVDLSDQPEKLSNSGTSLTIEITRRNIGADADAKNPRHVEYFYLILNEKHYSMDCISKTCTAV